MEKVLTDDAGSFQINMFEHDHQFFGNIEERGDGYSANKEIDDQCSLIEYANLLGLVPLPTDFIGQACI